jgi:retron-type reverse transcriptase
MSQKIVLENALSAALLPRYTECEESLENQRNVPLAYSKDAMRKMWKEIQSGRQWIVDADPKDFFGSIDHEKLLTLVTQRIADGRVLGLIRAMLKAGSYGQGRLFPTERGTPQGGIITP